MTWNSVANERAVETACALVELAWPVAEDEFPALAQELRWTPVAPGLLAFHSDLGVTPDLAMAAKVKGDVREITVNLVDAADSDDAARRAFLDETCARYREALQSEFGDPVMRVDEASIQESTWVFESGAACSLTLTPKMVSLRVDSPRQAHVRGVVRRVEAEEENSTPVED